MLASKFQTLEGGKNFRNMPLKYDLSTFILNLSKAIKYSASLPTKTTSN